MFLVLTAALGGFVLGWLYGPRLGEWLSTRVERWLWPAIVLALATPLAAQTLDTTVVCRQCLADTIQIRDSVPSWTYTTRDSIALRDSLLITPRPPAPPPPTAGGPPAGWRILSAQDCRTAGWGGTGATWYWRTVFVVTDPAQGSVCEWRYRTGYPGGTAPGDVWLDEAALRAASVTSVWFTGRLWISPHWHGHSSNVNKALFVGFGPSGNQFILNLKGRDNGPLYATLAFQGMGKAVGRGSCGAAGCDGAVQGRLPFPRGQWVTIALQFDATSAQLWQDGQLLATASGLDWRTTRFYLSKVALNPTWGGVGDAVPLAQQLRWDQVEVWRP